MNAWTLYTNLLPILFGAIIGSFLNVVIVRWPEERSIVSPGSACPQCGTPIAWYDNIPILSWILLRARCRHCGLRISWRYPAVELLTAGLSWLTFRRFVPDVAHIQPDQVAAYALYFAFVAAMVAITFIDFDTQLIPDVITLPGIPIGILGVWGLERLGDGMITLRSSIAGAAAGAFILLLVRGLYYLVRRQEGMGMGDVKMLALMGAFLGIHPALLFIIFVSSFLGSVVGITAMVLQRKDLKHALPFGPFLAIAGVVYLLWGYRVAPLFIPTELAPHVSY